MSNRLEELARRKARLIGQCARDRDEIARFYNQARLPLNLGGIIRAVAQTLTTHPALAVGVTGLIASGYAGKATKSIGQLALGRLALPLWTWWSKRRRK